MSAHSRLCLPDTGSGRLCHFTVLRWPARSGPEVCLPVSTLVLLVVPRTHGRHGRQVGKVSREQEGARRVRLTSPREGQPRARRDPISSPLIVVSLAEGALVETVGQALSWRRAFPCLCPTQPGPVLSSPSVLGSPLGSPPRHEDAHSPVCPQTVSRAHCGQHAPSTTGLTRGRGSQVI